MTTPLLNFRGRSVITKDMAYISKLTMMEQFTQATFTMMIVMDPIFGSYRVAPTFYKCIKMGNRRATLVIVLMDHTNSASDHKPIKPH